MNQLPKSVVREICTLRSVGAGGGRPPPATRCGDGNIPTYSAIDAAQFGDTRVESGGVGEAREWTGEAQPAGVIGVLQVAQKEPAEQARENPHRQEEAGAAGDPARAIERGAAAGHDAMDMRVMAPTPTIP